MGSYYSILSNDAESNGQHQFHFHVTEHQMMNWFRFLHGPLPEIELEVKFLFIFFARLSCIFLIFGIFNLFFVDNKTKIPRNASQRIENHSIDFRPNLRKPIILK